MAPPARMTSSPTTKPPRTQLGLEPALLLRRLLRHCFLPTFRHCCPPSHESHGGCRISAAANRSALHALVISAQSKKQRLHLTKCVRARTRLRATMTIVVVVFGARKFFRLVMRARRRIARH